MKNKTIVNKRAKFEYEILDEVEAGMVLEGREVKSLRLGRGSIVDAFVRITDGEAYLVNANIPGYTFADLTDYDPLRTRKLLMNKKELEALDSKMKSGKLNLVPLKIYPKGRVLKVLVGLARGKKQYQKKEVIKRRDLDREAKREMKFRE